MCEAFKLIIEGFREKLLRSDCPRSEYKQGRLGFSCEESTTHVNSVFQRQTELDG